MYSCEILSKAALKSIDSAHKGFWNISACVIASSTAATASKTDSTGTPQYWFGWIMSAKNYLSLVAIILVNIL